MLEKKTSPTLILVLFSSVLTIINGIWVAVNTFPIILSPFPVTSIEEVIEVQVFWGRVAFGIPGLVKDGLAAFWLIFPVAMLLCAVAIYMKPRRHRSYSPLITIFSLLSIPIGGGFYVGAILGFIGGVSGIEWPKSFRETFLGKIIRAVVLDSKFFATIRDDPAILGTAALTIVFVSILQGVGNGLYTYNLDFIERAQEGENVLATASGILLEGQVMWGQTPILTAAQLIGVTIIRWLLLSLAIYWVGVKLMGVSLDYNKIAGAVAFAYVPISFEVFLPVMFSNEHFLGTFMWPLGIYFVCRLWVFVALVVATAQLFDFTKRKALGVAILGGTMYWVIDHLLIIPTLKIPGIQFGFAMPESSESILLMISIATIVALLLGVFTISTRKH